MAEDNVENTSASDIEGMDRAGIFLLALGQERAARILKHMGPKEVQQIGGAMAGLDRVSTDMVETVMEDFIEIIKTQTSIGIDSDEYIRNMLTDALGEDKAGSMIDRILLGRNSKGLEQLKWMEPRAIADLIRLEHPQIIAIIISLLDADQAAEALSYLQDRVRTDVIMRIASLEGVQPSALKELDSIMEKQLSGSNNAKSSTLGGVDAAANILNFMETTLEAELMEQVMEANVELGQQIQDKMFVFDNLVDVDDRGIQTLLREISTDSLLLALRGAEDAMKEKIFRNMSTRAAEMLRDDLEAGAPAKLSEVEIAQKDILGTARRLEEAGEIVLGGGGGDELI